jgi:hypothetical protein
MKYRLALSVLVALLAQQAAAQDQERAAPSPQASLCVTTAIGTCGSICEPFQCLPNATLASPGEVLRFDIAGGAKQPWLLFTGSSVVGCQPISGIGGELGLWAPITTIMVGTLGGVGPNSCFAAEGYWKMELPLGMPLGMVIRFQVLTVNAAYGYAGALEFSRAVEMRLR